MYDLLKCRAHFRQLQPGAVRVRLKPGGQSHRWRAVSWQGNVVKVEQAPVTVIIGMDEKFYEKIPYLLPQKPELAEMFKGPDGTVHLMRNSSLQGAYLMLAARALGLDCGPMSGFDHAKLDAAFFAGTSVKSNLHLLARHREHRNAVPAQSPLELRGSLQDRLNPLSVTLAAPSKNPTQAARLGIASLRR